MAQTSYRASLHDCAWCRRNREEKKKLEFDWSDKKEADELDTKCAILRNEDTNKQFYPGAARFQEMYAVSGFCRTNRVILSEQWVTGIDTVAGEPA